MIINGTSHDVQIIKSYDNFIDFCGDYTKPKIPFNGEDLMIYTVKNSAEEVFLIIWDEEDYNWSELRDFVDRQNK